MAVKKNYRSIAYDYLRNEIISVRLKPNTPVVEQEIADLLNMSRTPVREAMKILETEGLLTNYPYQGTVVTRITTDDIKEICELRLALEVWALKKSINHITEAELKQVENNFAVAKESPDRSKYQYADNSLHVLIVAKSNSTRVMGMLTTLYTQIERFRIAATKHSKRWEESYKEHMIIIQYLREKNLPKCTTSLSRHLKLVEQGFLETLQASKFTM